MWYVIHAIDKEGSLEARRQARPAHLERLRKLQSRGRLLAAGPLPAIDSEDPGPAGFTGSLVIARFDNLAQARDWAARDPYAGAGVYREFEIYPFRQVLPP